MWLPSETVRHCRRGSHKLLKHIALVICTDVDHTNFSCEPYRTYKHFSVAVLQHEKGLSSVEG